MKAQAIKDRLKNIAKSRSHLLQEELTAYGLERTIYRISVSPYGEHFTLKGGIFLYALYNSDYPRVTSDIDLRADAISGEESALRSVFSDIFAIPCDDGITYDMRTLTTKPITKLDDYHGLNISVIALLGTIRIPISIDVGFGDVIVPCRKKITFPVLLDMDAPSIYAYSIESTLAEKFEAIVSLGYANSRYKDFYDIYVLLQDTVLEREVLKHALAETFANRGTHFDDIVVFEENFAADALRQSRWNAFVKKKSALMQVSFTDVVTAIKNYFEPLIAEMCS